MRYLALAAAALTLSCAVYAAEKPTDAAQSYQPGLGETMRATQMHHARIRFAGKAGNWRNMN